jgi:serine/threonine-protein kinase PknG
VRPPRRPQPRRRPGRAEGFCPEDGERFSFLPKLTPGTLVAGQYEVRGCLAHGGLGWIYLATDHNVDDRWVVLKGLPRRRRAGGRRASSTSRSASSPPVDHPGIVSIHNFVEHRDQGFIVMEYVGGSSLKQIMEARRRDDGSLERCPVAAGDRLRAGGARAARATCTARAWPTATSSPTTSSSTTAS